MLLIRYPEILLCTEYLPGKAEHCRNHGKRRDPKDPGTAGGTAAAADSRNLLLPAREPGKAL